jgi:hypothetical protein
MKSKTSYTFPKDSTGAGAESAAVTSPRPELSYKPIPPSKQPGTFAAEPGVPNELPDGGQTEKE